MKDRVRGGEGGEGLIGMILVRIKTRSAVHVPAVDESKAAELRAPLNPLSMGQGI